MKYNLAFRRYVHRVRNAALAGRLDAIRTLGALTIALATLTPTAKAQDAADPSATAKVVVMANIVGTDGSELDKLRYKAVGFDTLDACNAWLKSGDADFEAAKPILANAVLNAYGPDAGITFDCEVNDPEGSQ